MAAGAAQIWYELALFSACGLLLFSLDDVLVDLLWLGLHRKDASSRDEPLSHERLAIFIPAWEEAQVIAPMIAACRKRWRKQDYHIFLGIYPNDHAMQVLAASLAGGDLTVATNWRDGPTTKADCLNAIWQTFERFQMDCAQSFLGVVLHDAEDLVDPEELQVYRDGLKVHAMVQIPVLPLTLQGSRWVSGHYLDEFAEAHGKELVVRTAIGASLPSAGVGCAVRTNSLRQLALMHTEGPFAADSLTEDYEMGLRLAQLGQTAQFVRARSSCKGRLIAVRAHFPATLEAAVQQKSRWIAGIALAGWDRIGWQGGLPEWWMRWRDRRIILASVLILTSYATLLSGLVLMLVGARPAIDANLALLFTLCGLFALWRLAVRSFFVGRAYGWREGLRSIPRVLISNMIAVMAARAAIHRYRVAEASGHAAWGKTSHIFPQGEAR